ncbi:hypothetical protein KBZ18_07330 [Synechococcus sp. Cruz-9H2]|uniref:hypothetical protein n=1 Tax=unclassified Synechococcus TaxID=2626047 RepID=UPI0020CE45E0|nr:MULTISPECIES: hypothetical protein [unclassified Synechococcus]MCP9819303.1 hypothetical protein [Synechococcus sp. Cruz-9H2]MCP9854841.1 hypothetical protein [Synechococcus sp. Cruz-9C9]MCP9862688.1 hypothetical protein [Synechococcus sp. Cruz-7E5]MCP9870213.1 hypothetical protein [Synechococcus sp. Cruz-7B9]
MSARAPYGPAGDCLAGPFARSHLRPDGGSLLTEAIPGGALYFLATPERVISLHGIRPNQIDPLR